MYVYIYINIYISGQPFLFDRFPSPVSISNQFVALRHAFLLPSPDPSIPVCSI